MRGGRAESTREQGLARSKLSREVKKSEETLSEKEKKRRRLSPPLAHCSLLLFEKSERREKLHSRRYLSLSLQRARASPALSDAASITEPTLWQRRRRARVAAPATSAGPDSRRFDIDLGAVAAGSSLRSPSPPLYLHPCRPSSRRRVSIVGLSVSQRPLAREGR